MLWMEYESRHTLFVAPSILISLLVDVVKPIIHLGGILGSADIGYAITQLRKKIRNTMLRCSYELS